MFSTRLRELRKNNGMTQQDLATALKTKYNINVTRTTICKWETNYQEPMMYNVVCLADFFGVSVDYLMGASDNIVSTSATRNAIADLVQTIPEEDLAQIYDILVNLIKLREK